MNDRFSIRRANRLLIFLFLLFAGLYFARTFLVPVSLAVLLAMLMSGLANRLERWKLSRGLSTTICTLILVVSFAGTVFFVTDEVAEFANDLPKLKERAEENLGSMQDYVAQRWSISSQKQDAFVKGRSSSLLDGVSAVIQSILGLIADVLRYFVLISVYVFLMLFYRDRFYLFLLRLMPDNRQQYAREVTEKSTAIAEKYLAGRLMLTVILFGLYALGFTLIGLEHAMFMAMIGAVMGIIPIVGTIIGGLIPVAMAFITGSSATALGAIGVFLVAQIIENYVLTPLVVGSKVNLNPLFTIMAVILGGALWGAIGMIVFIPFLGMIKIVCDNVTSLQPFGLLIGKESKHTTLFINTLKKNS